MMSHDGFLGLCFLQFGAIKKKKASSQGNSQQLSSESYSFLPHKSPQLLAVAKKKKKRILSATRNNFLCFTTLAGLQAFWWLKCGTSPME